MKFFWIFSLPWLCQVTCAPTLSSLYATKILLTQKLNNHTMKIPVVNKRNTTLTVQVIEKRTETESEDAEAPADKTEELFTMDNQGNLLIDDFFEIKNEGEFNICSQVIAFCKNHKNEIVCEQAKAYVVDTMGFGC